MYSILERTKVESFYDSQSILFLKGAKKILYVIINLINCTYFKTNKS